MKSSTAKRQQSSETSGFAPTCEQAEKISAVEGLMLTNRMRRIVDRPASGGERRALIEAEIRKS
jgi:hypothetical protein